MDERTVFMWNDDDWFKMPFELRGVSFPLILLNTHFIAIIFSWFNWRYFISAEVSLLGDTTPKLYLAFVIIGTLFFFFVASLYMYASYRWASFLREKSRRNRMLTGAAIVYLAHVLPLWIMEFGIIWTYGWMTLIQGIHFVFLSIIWVLETILVWLAYSWHTAGFLHSRYGDTMFGAAPPSS